MRGAVIKLQDAPFLRILILISDGCCNIIERNEARRNRNANVDPINSCYGYVYAVHGFLSFKCRCFFAVFVSGDDKFILLITFSDWI